MTIFSFYCPACGESGTINLDTYELAPGREIMICPFCRTRFTIEIEYKSHEGNAESEKIIRGTNKSPIRRDDQGGS